tara:strand:- start:172 stop:420 length:249 start_codon:yes stop_codon:yes gene_type:complete
MFENRKYVIITLADYDNAKLKEMILNSLQSSLDSARKSVNEEKIILKWNGTTPSVFENMTIYTHSEILNVLTTSEWNVPIEE